MDTLYYIFSLQLSGRLSETSRLKARSPMQWNSNSHAGFSGEAPWLPINENYTRINVQKQEEQENSHLKVSLFSRNSYEFCD